MSGSGVAVCALCGCENAPLWVCFNGEEFPVCGDCRADWLSGRQRDAAEVCLVVAARRRRGRV
jgi:hypothetical protein